MYIIGAILAFSILVIVHEFGHFTLAKVNGVKVEQFSIGMGPKLIGVRSGETEYLIKLLPIGGYVKMLGDEGKSADERAFNNKSPLRKLSIVSAGPIANLILAIMLFSIIGAVRGYNIPVIDKVIEGKPAAVAGLKSGDKIIKINDTKINSWDEVVTEISAMKNGSFKLTYLRNGRQNEVTITPVLDPVEKRLIIGMYSQYLTKPNLVQSISYGFTEAGFLIKQTFLFFKTLFHGGVSMNDFGGPVSIIKFSGEAAKAGLLSLTFFGAYLSVQLAIFNIIPFPALDGGYIILFLYEIISGKKVDEEKVGLVNYIGFALLMVLMVLVTIKDILYPIKF